MCVFLCQEVTKYKNGINPRKFIRKNIQFVTNMSIIPTLAIMIVLRRKIFFMSEIK